MSKQTNYNKCHSLLSFNYIEYLKLFEEFADEQLIEEFIENKNYFKQSFFIQYIKDKFNHINAKQLFNDLYNVRKCLRI